MHQFTGYHGTSHKSAEQIVKSNFELSIGDDEWLGNGVYFFLNGISSKPEEQAKKWAIAQAWDKIDRKYKYNLFCVIKSIIEVHEDNLLDLTIEDGVEVLDYLSRRFEAVIRKTGKKLDYLDGMLINLARNEGILPIDVVKGNFYIKFVRERLNRISLRTPNCTICTVFDPNKNIMSNHILTIGEIKDEII